MYESLDIFVYSGTGNTYKTAEIIGNTAQKNGVKVQINMIDKTSKPENYKPSKSRLLGIMAPTIGTIQPASFFKFIIGLPKSSGTSVFLSGTAAWTKIGPLYFPGFVGLGFYLAALILISKGYFVAAVDAFGMPQNWTTLIPPYSKRLEEKICKEINITASVFADRIINGERIYKRKWDLIFGICLLPLTAAFVLVGHCIFSKTMFAGINCNGCGKCVQNCPKGAVRMKGNSIRRPYWTLKCEQCMRCTAFCPQKAADSSLIMLALYIVVLMLAYPEASVDYILSTQFALKNLFLVRLIGLLVWFIFSLLSVSIMYLPFFAVNKIKVINKVFTYLNPSNYWRKYHEPSVSDQFIFLNDIKKSGNTGDNIFMN